MGASEGALVSPTFVGVAVGDWVGMRVVGDVVGIAEGVFVTPMLVGVAVGASDGGPVPVEKASGKEGVALASAW